MSKIQTEVIKKVMDVTGRTDCYGSLISFMIDGYKWDEIDGMTPEFAKDLSDRLAIKIQYTSTDCQKAE